jgi:hypothetical protein
VVRQRKVDVLGSRSAVSGDYCARCSHRRAEDGAVAHYEALGRVEASINLPNALERAEARISETPEAGLPAPRPYPALAKAGRRWIVEGTYCSPVFSMRWPTFPIVFEAA